MVTNTYRELSAIMFTDIVGFTALAVKDENRFLTKNIFIDNVISNWEKLKN